MDISVIIPVRDRPEPLRRCLEGIRAGTLSRERYEIVVVDNGSTDETPRVAESFAGVRVVSDPLPNRCHARNRGAEEAWGAWFVFIDSDCVPEPGWLAGLAAAADDVAQASSLQSPQSSSPAPKIGLLAGPVRPAPAQTPVEAYIAARRWIDQEKFLGKGRPFSPPFAATANLAVRRDLFYSLGGLDPALAVAGEDADFCWRAAKAGWAIRYVPEAAVTHFHRSTLGGLWRQSYHYGFGQAELFAKWRGEWGAESWVEPRRFSWALKGLIKAPLRWVIGRDALARREPFYDFLANAAMIAGRVAGGRAHGVRVV